MTQEKVLIVEDEENERIGLGGTDSGLGLQHGYRQRRH